MIVWDCVDASRMINPTEEIVRLGVFNEPPVLLRMMILIRGLRFSLQIFAAGFVLKGRFLWS
jgi:hypothetical protein